MEGGDSLGLGLGSSVWSRDSKRFAWHFIVNTIWSIERVCVGKRQGR